MVPMTIQAVLFPVFVEVALIFALLGATAKSRRDAMKGGLRESDVALGSDRYPTRSRQISNAYANSFEMPTLFFAAVILAIVVHQAGTLFVLVEWLFVVARVGQAFIHTTSNKVSVRGAFFLGSAACTGLLWLLVALGVFGLA